jgi:hypothetical protein
MHVQQDEREAVLSARQGCLPALPLRQAGKGVRPKRSGGPKRSPAQPDPMAQRGARP